MALVKSLINSQWEGKATVQEENIEVQTENVHFLKPVFLTNNKARLDHEKNQTGEAQGFRVLAT